MNTLKLRLGQGIRPFVIEECKVAMKEMIFSRGVQNMYMQRYAELAELEGGFRGLGELNQVGEKREMK